MNRTRVTAAIVVGVIAVLAIVLMAQGRKPAEAKTMTGTTLGGQSFDLTTLQGKPVVINFFASWCPPCNAEAPDLAAFAKAHPEAVFVGVDTGEDKAADGQGFVAKYGLDYTIVDDLRGGIAKDWGVDGIPTTVFLDAQGIEKQRIVGATDQSGFEAGLAQAK